MHFAKPCLLIGAVLLGLWSAFPAAQARGADSERTITSGGRQREFILHVPPGAPPGPKPVVIALHGAMQPASVMQRYLDLDTIADREGFVVAYPKGINLLWNDGRSSVAGFIPILFPRDDGRFVLDVLDTLEREGVADSSRAYLMGFSNGGFLTAYMACRYADRFAAFATMMMTVPVGYASSCQPSRPVPILMMNGTYDPIVPMFGRPTPGARLMSASESAALFARLDGCAPPVETRAPHARILRWDQCAPGSAVAFYEIAGGHQPPSQSTDAMDALAAVVLGPRRSGLDAPQEIWSFFKRFGDPAVPAPSVPSPLLATTPPAPLVAAPINAAAMIPAITPAPTTATGPAGRAPILSDPDSFATAWQGIVPEKGVGGPSGHLTAASVTASTVPADTRAFQPMASGAPMPLQAGFSPTPGVPVTADLASAPRPVPSPLRGKSADAR